MEKSLPPTAMSSKDLLASTKPSDCEGIDCENTMKASGLLKGPLIAGATRGDADQRCHHLLRDLPPARPERPTIIHPWPSWWSVRPAIGGVKGFQRTTQADRRRSAERRDYATR